MELFAIFKKVVGPAVITTDLASGLPNAPLLLADGQQVALPPPETRVRCEVGFDDISVQGQHAGKRRHLLGISW